MVWVLFMPRHYEVPAYARRVGTQYWKLNTGSRIAYYKVESPSVNKKSPIIYLHGGPGGMIKDEVIEALKPLAEHGHDLYFYDQIGSGHSARLDRIEEYSVERHVADLREIIEAIAAEKVILIGHSWGCMLATSFLADHPDKVEKVILEGPGPILPIHMALLNQAPPDSLHLIKPEYSNAEGNRQAYNLRMKLIDKWAYRLNRKLASDQEVDDFFTYLNGSLSKSTYCQVKQAKTFPAGGGYYAHIMTVKSFDAVEDQRAKLAKVQIPVLILRGQCDNQAWGFTQEYLDLLPNARLAIIEQSGHDLIGGNEGLYQERIHDFLGTHLGIELK